MRSRLLAIVAAGVAAVALGACGNSTESPPSSSIGLTATNWATVATVPPTDQSTVPGATPAPGETVPTEQTYKVQSGDYPLSVSKKCGVTLQALDEANTTTSGYTAFYAGLEIKVPPGAIYQCGGETAATTTTVPGETATGTTAPAETTTTLAGGASNCNAGTYKLVAGDYPAGVAKKFDVTVDQLNAANVDTKGYSAFYVGLEIIIPAKGGCEGTTTSGA